MERDNELEAVERATREFLESLSLDKLRVLLSSPMAATLLDHCAESEILSRKLQPILDDEFDLMTLDDQERWNRSVVEKTDFSQEETGQGKFLNTDGTLRAEKPWLSMAASTTTGDQEPISMGGRVPFGSFIVGNSQYTVAEDSSGIVFLLGPVPGAKTHLYFGADAYELSPTTTRDLFVISGINSIKVDRFLARHRQDPENYPVSFEISNNKQETG